MLCNPNFTFTDVQAQSSRVPPTMLWWGRKPIYCYNIHVEVSSFRKPKGSHNNFPGRDSKLQHIFLQLIKYIAVMAHTSAASKQQYFTSTPLDAGDKCPIGSDGLGSYNSMVVGTSPRTQQAPHPPV